MQVVLYRAWSALPSKIFTVTLGLGGIVATVWPEKIKLWARWIATPGQIQLWGTASLVAFAVYWVILWSLKPTDAPKTSQRTPNQPLTLGQNSPALAGNFTGATLNFHNAQDATQPVKLPDVPHPLPSKGPIVRQLSEIEIAVINQKRGTVSRRDASLRDGIIYALCGEWGAAPINLFTIDPSQHALNATLEKFQKLAADGTLSVWGKPAADPSEVWTRIPREHFGSHKLHWHALFIDSDSTEPKSDNHLVDPGYTHLTVNRIEIERAWPHAG